MKLGNIVPFADRVMRQSQLLSKLYFNGIARKGERSFSREYLFQKSLSGPVVTSSDSRFNDAGIGVKATETSVDPRIPSIAGWVPLIKDRTSVVVYHFFSTNYGLRKQVFVRLTLATSSTVVAQYSCWLPSFSVHEFDLRELFNEVDGEFAVVEMFHPKLPENHGGHNGHLRFWGKYFDVDGTYSSTVHSLPIPRGFFFSVKNRQSRIYFLDNLFTSKNINLSYSLAGVQTFGVSDLPRIESHFGYNVVVDDKQSPLSIWHHAPPAGITRTVASKETQLTQAFWCPPNLNLDPMLVIDDAETGISKSRSATFFLLNGKSVIDKRIVQINGILKRSVSDIFGRLIPGPYTIACQFYSGNYGYLHVHYNSINTPGDQVHAHNCYWHFDEEKPRPKVIESRGLARKFLHIHRVENENSYLAINSHKLKGFIDPILKIRLFSDTGVEKLETLYLTADEVICVFNLQVIFSDLFDTMQRCAVVQIESPHDNFDGTLFSSDSKNNRVSVDHLSGG